MHRGEARVQGVAAGKEACGERCRQGQVRPRVETERALPQHERAAASGDQQLIQREHLSTEQRDENLGALVVNDRRGVPQSEEQRGERSIARRTLGLRSIVRGWCALRRCASAKGSRRVLLHEWRTPCRKCRTAHGGDGAALGGQGVGVCGSKQNAAEERSDRLHASKDLGVGGGTPAGNPAKAPYS